MLEALVGLFAGGAIMYFIQPPVKDFVTKLFLGAPAMLAKAQDLRDRAEALIGKAREKQSIAADKANGSPGA